MEYLRDEHRFHLIIYHLVWTPKRRKPILVGDIASDCQKLIQEKCDEKGWKILELAIQPDDIHLFLQAFPDNSPSEIVKTCKRVT